MIFISLNLCQYPVHDIPYDDGSIVTPGTLQTPGNPSMLINIAQIHAMQSSIGDNNNSNSTFIYVGPNLWRVAHTQTQILDIIRTAIAQAVPITTPPTETTPPAQDRHGHEATPETLSGVPYTISYSERVT